MGNWMADGSCQGRSPGHAARDLRGAESGGQYTTGHLQGGYLRIGPPQIRTIPIPEIDFSNKSDKSKHDRMVSLVERMLELHKQLAAAKSPAD